MPQYSERHHLVRENAHPTGYSVHRLTEIDAPVLALARVIAPDGSRRAHRGDRHTGADSEMAANNRIGARGPGGDGELKSAPTI